jgi:hypothetical protein
MLELMGLRNNTIFEDRAFIELVRGVYRDARALTGMRDLHNLYRLVEQTRDLPGDLAEVGVYRGGSARVICEAKGGRPLHLFDTFMGIPDADPTIDRHQRGDFADTSLEGVRAYLRAFDGLHFHPGTFPESGRALEDQGTTFSFVNLDVDVYESTLSALRFFMPRMTPGGILVSHDYRSISCRGVRRAFDEFFRDRHELVLELWDTQSMVVSSSA